LSGIVVGYDGTESSRAALEAAIDLAKGLGEPILAVFGYGVNPMGGEVKDHAEALRELGTNLTAEAVERARTAGAEAEAVLADVEGSAALTAVADERDARMIVVGSHGEGPIRGALLGSTAYHLVHISERLVLVVRA
jgi:nucleotide-binding universal stress UspA family protein